MDVLELASRAKDAPAESMAEARAAALGGITQLSLAITEHAREQLTAELAERVYQALLRGLDDYSVDRRGDIGSMCVGNHNLVLSYVGLKLRWFPLPVLEHGPWTG